MQKFFGRSSLLAVAAASLLVTGCASTDDVKKAQATADQALSTAQQAQSSAQQAQQTASAAQSAAQAAQQSADQNKSDIGAINQRLDDMKTRHRGQRG